MKAGVVAQLVEWSLPSQGVRGLSPILRKKFLVIYQKHRKGENKAKEARVFEDINRIMHAMMMS